MGTEAMSAAAWLPCDVLECNPTHPRSQEERHAIPEITDWGHASATENGQESPPRDGAAGYNPGHEHHLRWMTIKDISPGIRQACRGGLKGTNNMLWPPDDGDHSVSQVGPVRGPLAAGVEHAG